MTPLFKFPGGKRKLAPTIDTFRPEGWAVAEPFAGAAAYTLYALEHGAPGAMLSDADPRVMMIHQAIGAPGFSRAWVKRAPIPASKEEYLRLRAKVNSLLGQQVSVFTPPAHGVLLIQLSRVAYGGLWRTNRKGEFNVPPTTTFPVFEPSDVDVERVRALYARILTVPPGDFATFLTTPGLPPQFIYCDPPYLGTPFTGYGNGRAFLLGDHERLARWAEARRADGHVVAVSNECGIDLRRTLYPRSAGWVIHEVTTRRSIGAGTGGAAHAKEFLAVLGGAS